MFPFSKMWVILPGMAHNCFYLSKDFMAACNFSFTFSGDPNTVLQKARKAVTGQGGNFEGDTQNGTFDLTVFGNTIAGSYTVSGQNMDIVISEKPFLLPCSTIEGFLKAQLGL
jgi:hypothetical protein